MSTAARDEPPLISADYVIVGAGSAGCVLAERLSKDPRVRVVLVEAGGSDAARVVELPVGYAMTIGNPSYDWGYNAGPEPGLRDRNIYYARGKVLGGCSSINGLAWVRGARADYDAWLAQGCHGWGWDDVQPYLARCENFAPGGPGRGRDGPVPVDYNPLWARPMQLLQKAGESLGLPALHDYNVEAPLGLARAQLNWQKGRRKSASATYLKAARNRPNLTVLTDALAESLVVENGAVAGVRILHGDRRKTVSARAEVILSAGSIGTPLLLEKSGIGNPRRLQEQGIPVVGDAPEVGENLRDHMMVTLPFRLSGLESLNGSGRGLRAIRNVVQYALLHTGELAGTPTQLMGYARVNGTGPADVQLFAGPLTYSFQEVRGRHRAVPDRHPGMSLSFYQCRPRSVGQVHYNGNETAPTIVAGYLTHEEDRRTVAAALRLCLRLAAQEPLANHIVNGPPLDVDATEAELLDFAERSGSTAFHAVGSCRMGGDPASVVDLSLRARAVRRLRIVDASVMPDIVGANTHAPTMMLAERAADLIVHEGR